MIVAIMQPYFFPYLGYWQLIHAADKFVIYDDVNFIKKGWINRNRIIINRREYMLTLPLERASQNKLINEINVSAGSERLLRTIAMAYSKAPFFTQTMPLIEEIFRNPVTNLALFLETSIRKICSHIGIETEILVSSSLKKDPALRGQEKIVEMCRELGGNQYINSVGGKALYDDAMFRERGIELSFLEAMPFAYNQFGGLSLPSLSILDVLMFNPPERVHAHLDRYMLVKP